MRKIQRPGVELLLSVLFLFLTVFLFAPCAAPFVNGIASVAAKAYETRLPFALRNGGAENPSNRVKSETTPEKEKDKDAMSASFETPGDVLRMQADFRKKHQNASPSGAVKERYYTTDGATDLIGDVAVKNATETKKPDFSALLNAGPVYRTMKNGAPLVLVFHTHTTEAYLPTDDGVIYEDCKTRSEEPSESVVRVGDVLCAALEKNGIGTIHDTEIYDKAYNGAYDRSRRNVEAYLKKYPSVQIVLDVHRDAINNADGSKCKPTAVVDCRKAAQVMIITGAQEGVVDDFPGWEENLRFALCLQQKAQERFNGLMRPLYFCPRKYNMDLTPCSLLLEFGSEANTLEEALYAGHLMGQVIFAAVKEAGEGITENETGY